MVNSQTQDLVIDAVAPGLCFLILRMCGRPIPAGLLQKNAARHIFPAAARDGVRRKLSPDFR
jgi:hypothetical protein